MRCVGGAAVFVAVFDSAKLPALDALPTSRQILEAPRAVVPRAPVVHHVHEGFAREDRLPGFDITPRADVSSFGGMLREVQGVVVVEVFQPRDARFVDALERHAQRRRLLRELDAVRHPVRDGERERVRELVLGRDGDLQAGRAIFWLVHDRGVHLLLGLDAGEYDPDDERAVVLVPRGHLGSRHLRTNSPHGARCEMMRECGFKHDGTIFLAIDIFATATPLGRAEAAGGMESYQRDEFLAFIQRVLVRIHVPTPRPPIHDSHSNAPEPPPSPCLFRELKTPTPDACDDRARTTPAWRPRSRPWTSRTCASCVTPSPRRTTRASRARTSAHNPSTTTTSEDRAC